MFSSEDAHPIYMCVSPAVHLHSCMTTLLSKSTREAEARLPFLTGEAIATHHHFGFWDIRCNEKEAACTTRAVSYHVYIYHK